MATTYFPDVPDKIKFDGPDSTDPLAFKHYNPDEKVGGKTMRDHCRFAVCFWHGMMGGGSDPFGGPTRHMPWNDASSPMDAAKQAMHANFELITKLDVGYWCFHDRDIAPEVDGDFAATNKNLDEIISLANSLMDDTGIKLLWGTANLFSHRRYMSGAATSPNLQAFTHAGAQIKKAMEVTHELGGEGYTFWGGREGYDTLMNTRLDKELDHLAAMLHMAADYKKTLGMNAQFYIEPKPKEPTTHQYDHDASACHSFLQKYGLVDHLKLNIEANHATLAGHSFHHELEYCRINDLLGSIDANRGDELIGWDTDQFPTNFYDTTLCMLTLLRMGGFTTGGLNFDAKVRRQSVDPIDLVYAHVGGMDAFARGLKIAQKIIDDGRVEEIVADRYSTWDSDLGKKIEAGNATFADLEPLAHKTNLTEVGSGRQERLENIINELM